MRENSDWGCGGGRFRIDFPATGIVFAEEEGMRGDDGPDSGEEAERFIAFRRCRGGTSSAGRSPV